jgi:hypothetical protein
MEALEIIGKLIIAVISLAIVAYVWSWIMGGISKLFGTTMVNRSGTVISTPNTINENIDELKSIKNKLFASLKNIRDRVNSKNIGTQEKIKLLAELESLKKNGAVSDIEFIELKNQILNPK